MTEPPSIDANEITDKGYMNQRAVLERRSALVEKLYSRDREGRYFLAIPSQAIAPTTMKAPRICSGAMAWPRITQPRSSSEIGSKLSTTA